MNEIYRFAAITTDSSIFFGGDPYIVAEGIGIEFYDQLNRFFDSCLAMNDLWSIAYTLDGYELNSVSRNVIVQIFEVEPNEPVFHWTAKWTGYTDTINDTLDKLTLLGLRSIQRHARDFGFSELFYTFAATESEMFAWRTALKSRNLDPFYVVNNS